MFIEENVPIKGVVTTEDATERPSPKQLYRLVEGHLVNGFYSFSDIDAKYHECDMMLQENRKSRHWKGESTSLCFHSDHGSKISLSQS
jgi:hypothetical protein